MDKHTFHAIIKPMSDLYNANMTKESMAVYYSVLGNYEPDLLNACINELYTSSKWLPKPSEIVEVAKKLTFVNIFDAIESDDDNLLDHAIKRIT